MPTPQTENRDGPILMTGGSSGIGNATARMLGERGYDVVNLDIKPPTAKVASHITCDLSNADSIDAAVENLDGQYSALLNIAGVPGTVGPDLTMAVNLFGLRHLTDAVWPRLRDGANIVNIASIAGNNWRRRRQFLSDLLATESFSSAMDWWQRHCNDIDTDAYTFSKEAVVLYTMQLAGKGLDRNIRVNDIGPGPVDTPILPDFTADVGADLMQDMINMTGRAAQPEDIAEAVVTLATGHLRWVNGQHIIVDGGMTAGYSAKWRSR